MGARDWARGGREGEGWMAGGYSRTRAPMDHTQLRMIIASSWPVGMSWEESARREKSIEESMDKTFLARELCKRHARSVNCHPFHQWLINACTLTSFI